MYHGQLFFFFFFNDTATTEIYTLSLHDALPISCEVAAAADVVFSMVTDDAALDAITSGPDGILAGLERDRKSTRLNSSHLGISYAVFCLKKKKSEVEKLCDHIGIIHDCRWLST